MNTLQGIVINDQTISFDDHLFLTKIAYSYKRKYYISLTTELWCIDIYGNILWKTKPIDSGLEIVDFTFSDSENYIDFLINSESKIKYSTQTGLEIQ